MIPKHLTLDAAPRRGFALLIAVIFAAVMLTIGLALGSLGYKQQVISSSAVESQYAFYAADSALECALYYDQQQNHFAYDSTQQVPASAYSFPCDGVSSTQIPTVSPKTYQSMGSYTDQVLTFRLSLDSGQRCADVTVYKPSDPSQKTYLFSQGYDISCAAVESATADTRYVSRGLETSY